MEDRGLQARLAVAGRVLIAVVLLTLIGAYTYAVLSGGIGEKQRIDATHLVAILIVFTVCAVLLLPGLTNRIKTLELQGFKLDLDRVRERQSRQEVELEDVRLLIPLLLPDAERKRLTDLAAGPTSMTGSDQRRAELRKLTSLGLLRRREGRNIGDLKDGQTIADGIGAGESGTTGDYHRGTETQRSTEKVRNQSFKKIRL